MRHAVETVRTAEVTLSTDLRPERLIAKLDQGFLRSAISILVVKDHSLHWTFCGATGPAALDIKSSSLIVVLCVRVMGRVPNTKVQDSHMVKTELRGRVGPTQ